MCRKGEIKGVLLRLFIMLFLISGAMKMTIDAQASASETGVGLSQSLVGHDGSRRLESLVGQETDLHPLSSRLAAFLTHRSLDTFLPRFYTQAGGGGGLGGPMLGPGGFGTASPSLGDGPLGVRIIPTIRMAERYDSNIFFAPKLPGLDRQDWVTTVSPQVVLQSIGQKVSTTLNVGATGEYYVKNSGLSYIGYNARGSLNVTPLLRRFIPEASLFFSGSYSYTPNPPAFLGGREQSQPGVGEEITSQLPVVDTYIRGVQGQRVNTTAYTGGVAGSINYSPNLYVQGSYGYASMSFGTPSVTLQASGFRPVFTSTTTHSVSAGPVYKLSAFDSINLLASYFKSEFGSNQGGFQGYQGTLGYQKILDASLIGRVFGGVSVLTQDTAEQSATTSGNSEQQVAYTGGATLSWTKRNTHATVAYNTGIYPNYIGVPGAVISSNVSLQGTQRLDDDLGVSASLRFANNSAIGGQAEIAGVEFRSYSTIESLWYRIDPLIIASVTHEWGLYTGNFTGQGGDKIIRNAVTINLTKAWF